MSESRVRTNGRYIQVHANYNERRGCRMISNQILQNTIEGLKSITRIDLCIMDTEGKTLATTFPESDG